MSIVSTLTPANLSLAAAIWLAFVGGIFVLRIVLPGKVHLGQKLKDGSRRSYKLNGLRILFVLAAGLAVAHVMHWFSLGTVNRLFWPLFAVANVFALLHSAQLYLGGSGKRPREPRIVGAATDGSAIVAEAGTTPLTLVKDFCMGVELNPELMGVD